MMTEIHEVRFFENWKSVNVKLEKWGSTSTAQPLFNGLKVTEHENDGMHWAYCTIGAIPKDAKFFSGRVIIRNTDVSGVRIRISHKEIGDTSGWFFFGKEEERSEWPFASFHVTRLGGQRVEITFQVPVEKDTKFVSLGFVALNDARQWQYKGRSRAFILELIDACWRENSLDVFITKKHEHKRDFAAKAIDYCKGTGIEIGALDKPLGLNANVIFLDRNSTQELKQFYADDPRAARIRQVQIVWKGNKYPFLDDSAFDFVANSHVLEHVANPARQIEEWIRIIQPGGFLYMIVPDKRYCFDRRREVTTVSHLMDDYESNIEIVNIEHYHDYIINTNGEDGIKRDTSEEYTQKCYDQQISIHVHTFTAESFHDFLKTLSQRVPFNIVYFEGKQLNIHAALQKQPIQCPQ